MQRKQEQYRNLAENLGVMLEFWYIKFGLLEGLFRQVNLGPVY